MKIKESTNKLKDEVSLKDFIKQNKIGYGSYGKVYKVKNKKNKEIFAAKISNIELNDNLPDFFRDISREVNIISKLHHPSVLKFIYFSPIDFKNRSKPVIITELASNGTLKDFIEKSKQTKINEKNDDTFKLIIAYGIASGMSYLHFHDIIHRDLKPENILINENNLPKIADFGLSKIINNKNQENSGINSTIGTIKGTPIYISPEIWFNNEYTKACDVYAFGMILYELFTNMKPFENCCVFDILIKLTKGYRPELTSLPIPVPYKELIEQCWQQKPQNRPTFEQIVSRLKNDHDFITTNIDENLFLKYVKYIDEYETSFDASNDVFKFGNQSLNVLKKTHLNDIFNLQNTLLKVNMNSLVMFNLV